MENESKNIKLDEMMRDLSELGMDMDLRKEWESELRIDAPRSNQRFMRRALAIAAVFLLLVAIPFLIPTGQGALVNQSIKNIAQVENDLLENLSVRGEELKEEYVVEARKALESSQWAEAAILYDKVEHELSYPDQLLKAIAYNRTGNFDHAEIDLNKIINDNNIYSLDAKWILGNFYLERKNFEKSYEILSQIKDQKEYTSIEKLLFKLKREL